MFIVFDIEIVFLFPWAVVFKDLAPRWYWVGGSRAFVLILVLGLVYVWKRDARVGVEIPHLSPPPHTTFFFSPTTTLRKAGRRGRGRSPLSLLVWLACAIEMMAAGGPATISRFGAEVFRGTGNRM